MLKKAQKFVPILLGVIFVIFLGFVGYYYYKFKNQKDSQKEGLDKVLAVVGSEKITQRDLNELIYGIDFQGSVEKPKEIDFELKKEILENLIEYKIYEIKGKELNIEITDEEIENKIKEEVSYFDSLGDFEKSLVRKNIRLKILKEKVKEKVLSKKEGEYLIIRFDRRFYENIPGKSLANCGEELIKKDKEYAQSLANTLYEKLKNQEITFSEAIKIIDSDKRVSPLFYPPPTKWPSSGGKFYMGGETETWITKAKEVREKLHSLPPNTVSEPFVVSSSMADVSEEANECPTFFVILKVTNTKEGEADTEEEWLSKQKEKLGVKKYGEFAKGNFLNKALAVPLRVGTIDIKYKTADKNEYNLNGVKLDIETTKGCSGDDARWGSWKAWWQRDKNAKIDSGKYFISEGNKGKVCQGEEKEGFEVGCQNNPYNFKITLLSQNNLPSSTHYAYKGFTVYYYDNKVKKIIAQDFDKDGIQQGNVINAEYGYWYARWEFFNNAPQPSHVSPNDNQRFNTASITLTAKATDSDRDKVKLKLRYKKTTSNTWVETDWNSSFVNSGTDVSWDISVLTSGTYEWQVKAKDEYSAESSWSSSRRFIVEIPPQGACTISGPKDGYTEQPLEFTIISSCTGNKSNGKWYVDGKETGVTGTTLTYNFLTPGSHTVSYMFTCSNEVDSVNISCFKTVNILSRWQYFWREVSP